MENGLASGLPGELARGLRATDRDDLDTALTHWHAALKALGFAHFEFTIGFVVADAAYVDDIWVSSVPDEVLAREPRALQNHDPIFFHVFRDNRAVHWSEMFEAGARGVLTDPQAAVMRILAEEMGLAAGVSFPLARLGTILIGASVVDEIAGNPCAFYDLWQRFEDVVRADAAMLADHLDIRAVLARLYRLTPRERETLRALSQGQGAKEIAARSRRSVHTVEKQIASARRRIRAQTVPHAVAKAVIVGLI